MPYSTLLTLPLVNQQPSPYHLALLARGTQELGMTVFRQWTTAISELRS